jgi:hypothetical protein
VVLGWFIKFGSVNADFHRDFHARNFPRGGGNTFIPEAEL